MVNKRTFNKVKAEYFQTLKQYVPIVAKVHGKTHPEFLDLRNVFESLSKKIQESEQQTPALSEEFARLREITNNYTVPADVCESYEAVYKMIAELDKAYQA